VWAGAGISFEAAEEPGYLSCGFLPDSLFNWREGEIKQVIQPFLLPLKCAS